MRNKEEIKSEIFDLIIKFEESNVPIVRLDNQNRIVENILKMAGIAFANHSDTQANYYRDVAQEVNKFEVIRSTTNRDDIWKKLNDLLEEYATNQ